MSWSNSLYVKLVCILPLLVMHVVAVAENRSREQELLAKYLLQRLWGKGGQGPTEAIASIAERAAFEDLASSASVVYPEYESDAAIERNDYEYDESYDEVRELIQPSQTIATIVPAPSSHNKYTKDFSKSTQSPIISKFSMPLTTLGSKKYYLGIFFKANWARSAQYCRYHGMHLASVNTEEEQRNIEEHVQSLGFGHEHFWTSGTDQAEEGKFFWMSTGKPITYDNWNAGEPNNYKYEGGELEHCLELWNRDGKGLKWNDTPCSFETFFICEI